MSEFESLRLADYLAAIAARKSTPGGGSVAAVVAAEACALMGMVAQFSKGEAFEDIITSIDSAIAQLKQLASDDVAAFKNVMQAYRGDGDLLAAQHQAADVPAKVINLCLGQLDTLEYLAANGNANLISDVAIAALLMDSAIKSSELNILINIKDSPSQPAALKAVLDSLPAATTRLAYVTSTVRSGLQ